MSTCRTSRTASPGVGLVWDGYPDTIALPQGTTDFYRFADREFADPMNFDFRLQETSQFRRPGAGYAYKGPCPLRPMSTSSQTTERPTGRAFHQQCLEDPLPCFHDSAAGDTLYLTGGRYASAGPLTARQIAVRGRGMEPAVIDGPASVINSEDVSFERLHFTGATRAENSRNLVFNNCVFGGVPAVEGVNVQGLSVTHGLLSVP